MKEMLKKQKGVKVLLNIHHLILILMEGWWIMWWTQLVDELDRIQTLRMMGMEVEVVGLDQMREMGGPR
jgi:hypothetical protein